MHTRYKGLQSMKSFPPTRAASQPSWVSALAVRIRTLWLAKMLGTSISIAAFFPLYFWIMQTVSHRAVPVPSGGLDDMIAVQQWAIVPYASLWVYVSLPPAFAANVKAILTYATGALIMVAAGMAVYWLWPTYVAPSGIDWSQYPMLQLIKASDSGGNAFPSLHVAFALYAARVLCSQLSSIRAPRWAHLANGVWCAAIIYSTLATRQHVLLDVMGGAIAAWVSLHLVWGTFKLRRASSGRGLFTSQSRLDE